jgi:hypothetical protein
LRPAGRRREDLRGRAQVRITLARTQLDSRFRREVAVRLDGIWYLDKRATTDTIEPLTDEALRPIPVRNPAGMVVDRLQGASRWEREAVDCAVISPLAEVTIAEIFRLRATWSGAFYSHPVHRQRRVSDFHANVSLAAWLIYRFRISAEEEEEEAAHDQLP